MENICTYFLFPRFGANPGGWLPTSVLVLVNLLVVRKIVAEIKPAAHQPCLVNPLDWVC